MNHSVPYWEYTMKLITGNPARNSTLAGLVWRIGDAMHKYTVNAYSIFMHPLYIGDAAALT
jgi:hypothetical protein